MSNHKSVDSSLWWDPFSSILTDLENAPLKSQLPSSTEKKLKKNHHWFVKTVSLFKKPNAESKTALNSDKVKIGSHELIIKSHLKYKALYISSYLSLDEVQSYILVERSFESNGLAVDSVVEEYLHVVLLHYYIERQCLLKCTRQILMHALYVGISSEGQNVIRDEAMKLITDGLEDQLISALQDLLSSSPSTEMDVDPFTLWAEEILIEDNLVLDILFLIYYESLCTCKGETWRKLCLLYKGILSGSYNFRKLAISKEALKCSYQAKVQLLLILMETLNLENLLQMVHDESPFSSRASIFSSADIQQMDVLISSLSVSEIKEGGPLMLTWAVCLCLITSLPQSAENNVLTEIDHVGYLRQAFESASLSYFVEILDSDLLKESDGPVAGYRSVLRTFISAFIASYEINLQSEDSTLNLMLDILCKIYRGEESLCNQFWDKESFIDGPIRCLLFSLESEFPFRSAELVRLLSSLCEGSWPTECVFNFLDKSVGVSSLFEITSETMVDNVSQIVETNLPLHVPGVEGLFIPSKTRGYILKVIGENTALVRWEYKQSGLLILLLRLAKELYLEDHEDVFLTLDLLSRMVSFSTAVTVSFMELGNSFYRQDFEMNQQMERNLWVVEIICAVIKNSSLSSMGAAVMSMGVNILAKMFKCAPSDVSAIALKSNIFEVNLKKSAYDLGYDGFSSGSWLVSGKLARMLLIDSELNDYENPLTISVLELTMKLLESSFDNDLVLALVVFSLQFILINHDCWKYKVKDVRWRVTLKVLEVMKTCLMSISLSKKLSVATRDLLLCDSSIHSVIFRLVCTSKQTLENLNVSRLIEPVELDGFQHAISSSLDILYIMLSRFSEDISPVPVFHQAVLSSSMKPIPVVGAVMSLISFTRNPMIQVRAAKVLSALFIVADYLQPYLPSNACFGLDDEQIADLEDSVKRILSEQMDWNEDLFVAIVCLLTYAARHQPPLLVAILAPKTDTEDQTSDGGGLKQSTSAASSGPQPSHKSGLLDLVMQFMEKADNLLNSKPYILLVVLDFLKALWQGAAQYIHILEYLKNSRMLWKHLSNCISSISSSETPLSESLSEEVAQTLTNKLCCQSVILEMMAYEMFLRKKISHAESLINQTPQSKNDTKNVVSDGQIKTADGNDLKNILSSWCDMSILENLVKSCTSCKYDIGISYRAKVAASLFIVHVMGKLESGYAGSMSMSLLEKIRITFGNLISQPAFAELLAQKSQQGYSEGRESKRLILNDLYHHLQEELEGHKMGPGPFRELSLLLIESKCLHYQRRYNDECSADVRNIYVYDLKRIQTELGLEMWDHMGWRECKAIAQTMLDCMQQVNSMVMLSSSKLSVLRALITVLTMHEGNLLESKATAGGRIPEKLCSSCIDYTCRCFIITVESLAQALDASEEILNYLFAQAELLLHLLRSAEGSLSVPDCVLILKASGAGLKALIDFTSSNSEVKETIKVLLMLLLIALEFSKTPHKESEGFAEISNVCLGLLPILCECSTSEHCGLSLATVDLILRNNLTPKTCFPLIHKHLKLQHIMLKLQEENSPASIPIKLKFLLSLARVREGADMLLNAGFLSSLQVLFGNLLEGRSSAMIICNNGFLKSSDRDDKPQHIWGLGLAVITAMVRSLKESSRTQVMENVITYLFSEKAHLVSYYLDAPDLPSDGHDKKRPRAQRSQTSLNALKETEHTLMLFCTLAKHRNFWVKAMKEVDSQLREQSIHLLAFISRGIHHLGESISRMAHFTFTPISKEEFDWCKKPSFIKSTNGWFGLSPICCASKPDPSDISSSSTALVIRNQSTQTTGPVSPTYFSDLGALQIYRIAFLLLKFLCLEAEGFLKRSEEVGFIDLAHIPELPMPEILHGLQDQAIAVVSELCNANKVKQVIPEIQDVCQMLLQIIEMTLYLELCVSQICGIRPVLGRVEDFSKEVKFLFKAMEGHSFLKPSVKSLEQIISLIYPGSLQTEGFL